MTRTEKKFQVKFEVNNEQRKRLEYLAKERDMTVNQFSKLSALGIKISPAPMVFGEEKELLKEILKHFEVDQEKGKKHIFISSEFHSELISKIEDYLSRNLIV